MKVADFCTVIPSAAPVAFFCVSVFGATHVALTGVLIARQPHSSQPSAPTLIGVLTDVTNPLVAFTAAAGIAATSAIPALRPPGGPPAPTTTSHPTDSLHAHLDERQHVCTSLRSALAVSAEPEHCRMSWLEFGRPRGRPSSPSRSPRPPDRLVLPCRPQPPPRRRVHRLRARSLAGISRLRSCILL